MSDLQLASDLDKRRRFLFRVCKTREELHDWILVYLGLDLPDCTVHPDSNSNPMEMVWEVYQKMLDGTDESFLRVLYYASRDSFKTLGAAVIEVLSILHCNRSAAHMAAIGEQALKSQEYVKRAFRRPFLRDFVDGNNERLTKIVRYYNPTTEHSLTLKEYETLSTTEQENFEQIQSILRDYIEKEVYVKIVICTMQGANSEHVPLLIIDEVDVVANPKAYEEAQNIPAGRGGKLPLTILTSTRKQAFGLVQKEIDRAEDSGLQIRHWNIVDVTKACEPRRHKPELPKLPLYVSDDDLRHTDEVGYQQLNFKEQEKYVRTEENFAGCKTCKLFTACRGRLATHQKSNSLLLKSIPEVIGKFKANSTEMALAQLLCKKPSSTGLIYGRFSKTRHVITPAEAYEKVFGEPVSQDQVAVKNYTKTMLIQAFRERGMEAFGGIDWGHTHNFAHVQGFKDASRFFVTGSLIAPGLDPDQMLMASESFKENSPKIYPDTADPKMIKLFRKYGWSMINWKKGPGTVDGGISVVRHLLNPFGMADPFLYFVADVGEDEHMATLINSIAEYHYKLDSSTKAPTNVPDEDNDDGPDALRYMLMNVFSLSGKIVVPAGSTASVTEPPPPSVQGYDPQNWIAQKVAELTGQQYERPAEAKKQDRPSMTIDAPEGSGFKSYYGSDEEQEAKQTRGRKGKKGRLTWDI